MTDRWVVLLAASAAVGALVPTRGALLLAAAAGVVALAWRRPATLCLVAALVTSGLAQRALDGLEGAPEGPVAAEVTLLTDPEPSFGGLRAEVRLGARRLEARADGTAARDLEDRLAGEVVRLRGTLGPVPPGRPWLVARHISGRLTVLSVEGWRPGDPTARLANGLRRTLESGAGSLGDRQRSLFTGLVYGDERHQPVDLADDFLGAGLTHLLAVSGQNVAFVLALAAPLLRRLRLWPRLLATLGVIGLFGVMTRFEPSVLRASAMAALAATIAMAGHPTSRVRIIGLATTLLLVVDPLLVRSAGFQLSVSAAAAIVVLAPSISAVLPGPAAFREPLGVTVAAQLGVAPVLLLTFGPIPVASVPANLLAVPVAGLVMVWGLTGGLVAGVLGDPVASVLHGPTRLALGWLELVADRSAHAPLGQLGLGHVVALAAGLTLAMVAHHRRWSRRLGLSVAAAALLAAALVAHAPPPLRSSPSAGVVRWHGGGAEVVVLGGGDRAGLGAAAVLEGLRTGGVRSIDVLVVADPEVPDTVVGAVLEAHPTGAVVAQSAALVDEAPQAVARVPPEGVVLDLGDLRLQIVVVPGRLVVDAVPRRS